jgi:predicted alpha/beta-fold hydrolase
MAVARSGFTQTIQGLTITKDTEAQLIYTFEWNQWLPTGDTLSTAVYTITARANDPDPLVIVTQGLQGTKTYVELKEGQVGKSYSVSCKVTTADGLIDRRIFRVKIADRSA